MSRFLQVCLLAAACGLLLVGLQRQSCHAADAIADQAQAILDATEVQGGIVVHLGCGDGKLTAALRSNESYQVQGLARDWLAVQAARKHVQELDLYGPVSIDRLTAEKTTSLHR